MLHERRPTSPPLLSVCIPQHNRTTFLLQTLKSLEAQTFRDFEVCISDDCSTDGREAEVVSYLEQSNLGYIYERQTRNLRYDANLRAALGLARGRYLFLLGNDDAIANPEIFAQIAMQLQRWRDVGVVFTNYEDFLSGAPYARIQKTEIIGAYALVAAQNFRNFSFVSGILLLREPTIEFATSKWDGSEMYQMYMGCRMIAAGYPLSTLNLSTIRKDIYVSNESVESYATVAKRETDITKARNLPMRYLAQLTVDAILPYVEEKEQDSLFEKVVWSVYLFPYMYWLLEYRRIKSWKYAVNVAQGMAVTRVTHDIPLSRIAKFRIYVVYWMVTLCGLFIPTGLFTKSAGRLHQLAKRIHL